MMKSELLSGNDICPDKVLKNSGTNEPMIENDDDGDDDDDDDDDDDVELLKKEGGWDDNMCSFFRRTVQ